MSIKRESVKAIFRSITESDNISRSTISKETGLSLMTVGKVIDALLDLGVIYQVKETKSAAGRKAGLISLKNDSFMLIIDLTSNDYSISILDIKLGVTDRMVYSYNKDFYYEENLFIFLKNTKSYLNGKYDLSKLIGAGVILPGRYNNADDTVISPRAPGLENIKIKQTVEKALDIPVSFFEEDIKSAALSNINSIQNDENGVLLYTYIGKNHVAAVTIIDGDIHYGENGAAGNIKDMLIDGVKTYQDVLAANDKEAFISSTATVIHNMSLMIDPSKIVIECQRYDLGTECINALKGKLSKLSPDFAPEILLSNNDVKHSHRGIAMKMREKWLEQIIK